MLSAYSRALIAHPPILESQGRLSAMSFKNMEGRRSLLDSSRNVRAGDIYKTTRKTCPYAYEFNIIEFLNQYFSDLRVKPTAIKTLPPRLDCRSYLHIVYLLGKISKFRISGFNQVLVSKIMRCKKNTIRINKKE